MKILQCNNCDKYGNQCNGNVVRQIRIIGNLHGIAESHRITVYVVNCSKCGRSKAT